MRAAEGFTTVVVVVVDMSKESIAAQLIQSLSARKRVRYGPVRIRTHDRPIIARRSKFGAVFGAWRAVRFAVFIVKRFPRIVKSRSLQKRSNDTSTSVNVLKGFVRSFRGKPKNFSCYV